MVTVKGKGTGISLGGGCCVPNKGKGGGKAEKIRKGELRGER